MNKHRIGALVAAAALTLTFAGTAFANDLHQDLPITGTEFKNTEVGCDEGWHFIHTGTSSADLPSEITVKFEGMDAFTVDGHVNGNSIVMYDVTGVSPDATLTSASDNIENDGNLNLSHVCLPEETTTTTTEETTEETTTTTEETTTTTTTEETTSETTSNETTSSETTSEETTSSETTSKTTTPSGSVEELTPPQTDTIGQSTGSSTVSTGLLLVLAGILALVLVVAPAAVRNRR